MSAPAIDPVSASRRLKRLISAWRLEKEKADGEKENGHGELRGFSGADAICIIRGSAADDLHYRKSVAIHLWLFGYEVPGTKL